MKSLKKNREYEKLCGALFENSPDAILILDGNILIECNQAAVTMMRCQRKEELLGLHPAELSPEKQPCGSFSLDLANEFIGKALEKGCLRLEWTHRRFDGEEFPAEVLLTAIPFKGKKVLFTVWRDISSRKEAQKALRDSEEKYRLLLEHANDMILIVQDKIIVFHNERVEELLGHSNRDISGAVFTRFIHPDEQELMMERHLRRTKDEQVEDRYTCRWLNKHGKIIWTENNVKPISWEGRPAGLGILRDITKQKELEMKLLQARKMEAIGTLAGGIAHDFNNILASMIGFTEMMIWKDFSPAVRKEYHQQILQAGYRARDLVKQILAFSRQDRQEFIPLDITVIIKEAAKLLRATLPSTIQIREHFTDTANKVLADPVQIHQVLISLCTNAAYAMKKKGGILEIGLAEMDFCTTAPPPRLHMNFGRYQKLWVSDTGEGMDPKAMVRAFDPFFTTKPVGDGTGMGLSVVYGIVKNHNGEIILSSEPLLGTTADVYFPCIRQEKTAPVTGPQILSGGKERILIVDDEPSILEMNRRRLEYLGYTVTAFSNSLSALDSFRTEPDPYDLVITDMTMPDMNGAELAKEILTIRPRMPIILCTGFSDAISQETASEIGIRKFMFKPVVLQDLSSNIRTLLEMSTNG